MWGLALAALFGACCLVFNTAYQKISVSISILFLITVLTVFRWVEMPGPFHKKDSEKSRMKN